MNARLFEELRPVGFAVAYRMLGRVSEAEDIVQEAFLRLHHTLADGERIESPRAYLATVVTRLCIDHLRSARTRRESYVEALPEPLVGEPGAAVALVPARGPAGVAGAGGDPASHAEMADSLSLAFLVLLESLSPEQRAAFLLRRCAATARPAPPPAVDRAGRRAATAPPTQGPLRRPPAPSRAPRPATSSDSAAARRPSRSGPQPCSTARPTTTLARRVRNHLLIRGATSGATAPDRPTQRRTTADRKPWSGRPQSEHSEGPGTRDRRGGGSGV